MGSVGGLLPPEDIVEWKRSEVTQRGGDDNNRVQ